MTWDQAERYLAIGIATLAILPPEQVERLIDDLGPVELLAVQFEFERGGVPQTSTYTVTRRRAE